MAGGMTDWKEFLAFDKKTKAWCVFERTKEWKDYEDLEKLKIDEYEGDPDKFRKDYDIKKSRTAYESLPQWESYKEAKEEWMKIRWSGEHE